MKIESYKDLIVWQRAVELVKKIYYLTERFLKDELFGLRSQMERAVVSIPSQIAEGYLRKHKKEYTYFLSVALGSAAELETQILVCKMLKKFEHLDFAKAESLNQEVMKMLFVMIEKIEGRR